MASTTNSSNKKLANRNEQTRIWLIRKANQWVYLRIEAVKLNPSRWSSQANWSNNNLANRDEDEAFVRKVEEINRKESRTKQSLGKSNKAVVRKVEQWPLKSNNGDSIRREKRFKSAIVEDITYIWQWRQESRDWGEESYEQWRPAVVRNRGKLEGGGGRVWLGFERKGHWWVMKGEWNGKV